MVIPHSKPVPRSIKKMLTLMTPDFGGAYNFVVISIEYYHVLKVGLICSL